MGFFNFFKPNTENWDSYKNYLSNTCLLPFTTIVDIDKETSNIASQLLVADNVENRSGETKVANIIGLINKLLDGKFSSIYILSNKNELNEIQESINMSCTEKVKARLSYICKEDAPVNNEIKNKKKSVIIDCNAQNKSAFSIQEVKRINFI